MEGYIGTMYSLSVAIANLPIDSLALAAELAAELLPASLAAAVLLLPFLELLRIPRMTPRTIATITMMKTGIPNFIQLLVRFLTGC